ncbi:MAG: DUF4369 domain-containing protein, partial [Flavobacteriaceae bacterium]|nr:DUF4369 domain-containing protein [Muriicola sp.]NNL39304.1 DUF4369 domain-containing protein [Flavobacteriaceae bacterium]
MKQLLILLSLSMAVVACNSAGDGYVIEGSIEGENTEGTELTLRKYGENNQLITVDSAEVKEGTFMFKG